ncbi:MMPL family transporter [Corynebacterium auriscanis]|uniref:MMPL family transporter n=1 Tax=Corynebacterium auriscanis TaxID=99807 RepID=UPI0022479396|nr:MMPL family transporter [Corynebacterium auriscanis]MCX2163718.1 MMPL family transporter [Corynebacterium auriscanis]
MAKFLFHTGRWSFLHKWMVLIFWLVTLAAVAGSALTFQKGFNDLFEISDVPTTHATETLMEKFPGTKNPAAAADVNVVFQAPEGHKLDEPQYMKAMDETVQHVKDHVPQLGDTMRFHNPVTMNAGLEKELVRQLTAQGLPELTARADADNLRTWSADGRTGIATFSFDVPLPADVTKEDRDAVYDAIAKSRDAGLTVEVGGPGFGDPIAVEPISEIAGVIVALIILFITFGSLIAAGLPLITAVIGVGIGALLTVGATAFGPLNSMTPTLGVMIGLAVGIDYALFIMSRYRDELKRGRSKPDAIGLATGTAGSAVVFAGLTVIIALLGLRLAGIPFLAYMGYSAAAFVFIAVLVALTLLPALVGIFAGRLFKKDAARAGVALADSGNAERGGVGVTGGTEVVESAGVAHRARATDGAEAPHRARTVENAGVAHRARTAESAGIARRAGATDSAEREGLSMKWVKLVHRVPGLMLALVMACLAALTTPAMDLQLSLPSDSTSNVDSTQRKAAELTAEGFGAGRNAPFLVLVNATNVNENAEALKPYVQAQLQQGGRDQAEQGQDQQRSRDQGQQDAQQGAQGQGQDKQQSSQAQQRSGGQGQQDVQQGAQGQGQDKQQNSQDQGKSHNNRLQAARSAAFIYAVSELSNNADVKHAQLVGQSPDGTTAQILVTPNGGPIDERTVQLIHGLRSQQTLIEAATGADMGITGFTPIQQDVTDKLEDAMPIYLGLVVGLALLLLLMVFRSLLVPVMAAAGFLLSVGAAFGVTVLVWQKGLWGLWDSPGPLISFMPIFLIGVTFGLAMDYQVFIVSRMRERFIHESKRTAHKSPYTPTEDSVIFGFGLGARVVTAAALIMIGVFASFVFQPLPFIQIFGFALGAGVLFDAFFIRMTAIPALMILHGRWTWYMPKWLDKILPTFDVEGEKLEAAFNSGEIHQMDDDAVGARRGS